MDLGVDQGLLFRGLRCGQRGLGGLIAIKLIARACRKGGEPKATGGRGFLSEGAGGRRERWFGLRLGKEAGYILRPLVSRATAVRQRRVKLDLVNLVLDDVAQTGPFRTGRVVSGFVSAARIGECELYDVGRCDLFEQRVVICASGRRSGGAV